jgi:hypothetical protein
VRFLNNREFAVATGSHRVAFPACGAGWLRHYGGSCNDAFNTYSNVLYSTTMPVQMRARHTRTRSIDSFISFLRNDLQKGSELDSGLENGFLHRSATENGARLPHDKNAAATATATIMT